VLGFASHIDRRDEPEDVLDALHRATVSCVNLLGAWRVPSKRNDWDAYVQGKTIFYHASAPAAFWPEYWSLVREHGTSVMQQIAWRNQGSFTFTEAMRLAKTSGSDRWIFELTSKHGMRDGFYCPLGRWMVVYWSANVLKLSPEIRGLLYGAASIAAVRLEQLMDQKAVEGNAPLTSRELASLRLLSFGRSVREIANELELRPTSVKTYLARAQKKLGTKHQVHAVAEAMRRYLVI